MLLSHYLNDKLGNVGKKGGLLPPAPTALTVTRPIAAALANARVIFIDGANPAYILPPSSGVFDALKRAELVVSFSSFLDDSSNT